MTDNNDKPRPTHTIYKVVGDGADGQWTKIGAAFPHKDGKGLGLVFDELPTEGRMVLRIILPKATTATHLAVPARTQMSLPIILPDPLRRIA